MPGCLKIKRQAQFDQSPIALPMARHHWALGRGLLCLHSLDIAAAEGRPFDARNHKTIVWLGLECMAQHVQCRGRRAKGSVRERKKERECDCCCCCG